METEEMYKQDKENQIVDNILNIEVHDQDMLKDTDPKAERDVSCSIYAPEHDKENQAQEPNIKSQTGKTKKKKFKKKSKKPICNDDAVKEPQILEDQPNRTSVKPISRLKGTRG